jgi:hypothetical protein
MLGYLLMTGAAVALMAAILTIRHARAIRRTLRMRALARRMGWRFQASAPLELVPERKRFGLFTVRMHQRMRNHLSGTLGEFQVAVFDLRYSTTSANPAGSEQTVVHLRVPGLELPAFSLRPEQVFHRSGDSVGGLDIDLRKDPEFSQAYHLAGRDEEAIRDLFDRRVRDVYRRNPGLSTDAAGSDLLFWRRGEVVADADVAVLVQAAVDVARLHGRAAYQITGRRNGNHTPHVAARIASLRGAATYDDLF